MNERETYRQQAQAAERTWSLYSILEQTPRGRRAYIWEHLDYVCFHSSYIAPGEQPPATSGGRSPERVRIALGPLNGGDGPLRAISHDNPHAHLEVLFEGMWPLGKPYSADET